MENTFRFSVVSAFCGAGGSSLGYEQAGGKVLLAVDNWPSAVETYRMNFPETPTFAYDIAKLSVEECCRLAQVLPGQLGILDGSPPCQGFSMIGGHDFADRRNRLYEEFVRLLRGLRPKAFVMENVSGMVKGHNKLIFADCLRAMKHAGYRVRARLLNVAYFGVPQERRRIIFVGVREDLGIEPCHPRAQGEPRTVRQALGLVGDGAQVGQPVPQPRPLAQPRPAVPGAHETRSVAGARRRRPPADADGMWRPQRFPRRLQVGAVGAQTHRQRRPASVHAHHRRARKGQRSGSRG